MIISLSSVALLHFHFDRVINRNTSMIHKRIETADYKLNQIVSRIDAIESKLK